MFCIPHRTDIIACENVKTNYLVVKEKMLLLNTCVKKITSYITAITELVVRR